MWSSKLEPVPAKIEPEIRTSAASLSPKVDDVDRAVAVRHLIPDPLRQPDSAGVVGTDHEQSHCLAVGEAEEAVGIVLRGAPIDQMVWIDVGDNGDLRRILQERAVALVRLDHQDIPATDMTARLRTGERTADDEGRVQRGTGEHGGDHRGGSRLAVSAGDRDPSPVQHERAKGCAAVQHPKAPPSGLDQFGIVVPDGRRCHDRTGLPQLICRVTDVDSRASGLQCPQVGRVLSIAAADGNAELQEGCGDAVHSRPADRDEVNRSEVCGVR